MPMAINIMRPVNQALSLVDGTGVPNSSIKY